MFCGDGGVVSASSTYRSNAVLNSGTEDTNGGAIACVGSVVLSRDVFTANSVQSTTVNTAGAFTLCSTVLFFPCKMLTRNPISLSRTLQEWCLAVQCPPAAPSV